MPSRCCDKCSANHPPFHLTMIQSLKVAVVLLNHDSLLKCSSGREFGIKDSIHLLECSATGLHAENVPYGAIYQVEADEYEVVSPVD